MGDLAALEGHDGYVRLFTSVELWAPYVREACRRHGLEPCREVRVGVPGTYPAFIVEDRWVVKFFGRLFDGGRAFQVEREAARLVQRSGLEVATARVAASGELGGAAWPWPYLIFDFIPGQSIGQVWDEVSPADRLRVAREMGALAGRLHTIPLDGQTTFPNGWGPFVDFLREQREICVQNHRGWGTLPARLVDPIDAFLPPVEALVDRSRPPHLIHADLTRDHLLGRFEAGHWQTLALIDFGDARAGSLLYELPALHLDLFGGDRGLLASFFKAYGGGPFSPAHTDFPRLALSAALLHPFNVLSCLPPDALDAESLEELSQNLWDLPQETGS